MARSHPPAVITSARRVLLTECQVTNQDTVLLAVSGGMDSMCLLHVLAKLRSELGFGLLAHGVDHGLREAAQAELEVVKRFASDLGVEFSQSRVEVAAGGNVQERARELRYAVLNKAAVQHKATLLATAHHADDRAETVIMRLLRGAGPAGLAVLPARAAERIRPLIRVRRADIARHVERHRIPYSEDPSNVDRRFLRSQVRHDLLPLCERMSPGIVGHLSALADALAALEAEPASGQQQGGGAARGSSSLTGVGGLGRAQLEALRAALSAGVPGPRIRLNDRLELRLERANPVRSGQNRSNR